MNELRSDSVADVPVTDRIVLGWLTHSTFTACLAAVGYTRHTRSPWRQVAFPLLGYLLAVGLHSFFDFVDFQASAVLSAVPAGGRPASLALVALMGNYFLPFLAQVGLIYILILY